MKNKNVFHRWVALLGYYRYDAPPRCCTHSFRGDTTNKNLKHFSWSAPHPTEHTTPKKKEGTNRAVARLSAALEQGQAMTHNDNQQTSYRKKWKSAISFWEDIPRSCCDPCIPPPASVSYSNSSITGDSSKKDQILMVNKDKY